MLKNLNGFLTTIKIIYFYLKKRIFMINIKKTALALATSALMSGSVFAACSADIDMNGNKITNLACCVAYFNR
jgi:hypothetical protein